MRLLVDMALWDPVYPSPVFWGPGQVIGGQGERKDSCSLAVSVSVAPFPHGPRLMEDTPGSVL